jgi:bifunctional DNA-binding transcriptional regulator/antitoxin component of YhaV-PrlF toxin-antitoxin module
METLIVDADGRVVISSDVSRKFGLTPGDRLMLVQTPEGVLVCGEGQAFLEEWWHGLSEEDKIEARKEADWYESLSEEERDALWNTGMDELEVEDDEDEDEGDEIGVSTIQTSAR